MLKEDGLWEKEFQVNPFTPTFGSIPLLLAGRQKMIHAVLNGLRNGPGDPNRATIFIGARGSGKTVLLTKIADEASKIGWISANVTASETMLDEIVEEIALNGAEFFEKDSAIHLRGINVAGFGVNVEVAPEQERTWRTKVTLACQSVE
jgi:hypothetical protein